VDTTNGYVLDKQQLDAIPLPTGSFTGVAILSPGVNAELPQGTGANSGLGNQPILANGQRRQEDGGESPPFLFAVEYFLWKCAFEVPKLLIFNS
jgi:hypothetical protein